MIDGVVILLYLTIHCCVFASLEFLLILTNWLQNLQLPITELTVTGNKACKCRNLPHYMACFKSSHFCTWIYLWLLSTLT